MAEGKVGLVGGICICALCLPPQSVSASDHLCEMTQGSWLGHLFCAKGKTSPLNLLQTLIGDGLEFVSGKRQ